MIAYPIAETELETAIEAEKPGWLADAAERTAEFKRLGRYEEKSPNWSVVKPVYMRLQGDCKCAYCERKLASEPYGKGEHDVEHFRPKKRVQAWKLPKELADAGVVVASAPAGGGYHLLAYHPLNYAAACAPCNQALKKDYFPIAGKYALKGSDPEALMKAEKPLLIYPIGNIDTPAEKLIAFRGVSPYAVFKSGPKRMRALTTIAFFKLDSVDRKELLRERAMLIVAMYPQLEQRAMPGNAFAKTAARKLLMACTAPTAPHANCARSFEALYASGRDTAQALYKAAADYVVSGS